MSIKQLNPIIFSGSSNPKLAKELAGLLNWPLGKAEISKFSDDETYINIESDVKGKNVFVLQSCPNPANHNLMELLVMIDALKRLKPAKITAILPFYPYRRQEKNAKGGESITAELVARLLEAAGADKILLTDIHTDRILKFFKRPVKNLEATNLFLEYFKNLLIPPPFKGGGEEGVTDKKPIPDKTALVVMAPDKGALQDCERFAKKIGASVACAEKHRDNRHDKIDSMVFRGEVKNKNILIIDDEINTAGTLCEAARLLKKAGAKNIYACCTHPVFSGEAISRLKKAPFTQIIVTDTICLEPEKIKPLGTKLKILSIAPILAEDMALFRQNNINPV